ncbi:MAG TPA: ABC transporter permease [Acidimicrobiales bacterium]|nr:ABC transporter permease [Acidimicrobiales bacterium]
MTLIETPTTTSETLATVEEPARRRRLPKRRVLVYLFTVFFLVTLNFFLPRTLTGDPIAVLAGSTSTGKGASVELSPAAKTKLMAYYGLDKPLITQYGHYLRGLAHGDLGTSIKYNVPVTRLLKNKVKWSAVLVLTAVGLATVLGTLAGIHSGWRRGKGVDRGLLGVFIAVGNFPAYVLAMFALVVFVLKLHWFPAGGAQTPYAHYALLRNWVDIAWHVILPAAVMSLNFLFLQYLVMRGAMVAELGSDYLVLGRVKGLSQRSLKYRYAARNALLPVATVVALNLGLAMGTSLFVERVFKYPGVAGLMFDSISNRDYPTMQGCFLLISVMVVTVNFIADFIYPRLDPRVSS